MTLLANPILMTRIEEIRTAGGGTFDKDGNPATHQDGFYVGTRSFISGWYSLDDIFHEIPFHFWPEDYPDLLGFWQSPDLYWYVDFVTHFDDFDEAKKAALLNNEYAVFDIAENKSIPIPIHEFTEH